MNVDTNVRPTLPECVSQMLQKPGLLSLAVDQSASPIALVFPEIARSTVCTFRDELRTANIHAKIFAAHKATGSRSIIASLKSAAGIDVASYAELDNALRAGFLADEIIATGPKTSSFLAELAARGVTIVVDSYEELVRLTEVSQSNVRVLLRVTRTMLNGASVTKQSRFGMDQTAYRASLDLIRRTPRLVLRGIAFHLDSQSLRERITAVRKTMKLLTDAQIEFPSATVLDIGGGYGASYGVTHEATQRYEAMLKRAVINASTAMTWQGYGYGLSNKNGQIIGTLQGFDVADAVHGSKRLTSIFEDVDESGTTLAQELNDNLIEIWTEPGAALFSESGVFVCQVIEVHTLDGEDIVVVDAHRNQICFENNEALVDPLLISSEKNHSPGDYFIAGHLCAENDMMTFRKIHFERRPQPGDLMAWTHTGAYRMHFSASQSIGHPLARQYAVTMSEDKKSYTLTEDI